MDTRYKVAALSLSAAGLVGMAVHEGYRGTAYYATDYERQKGISTIGFGETKDVRPTDTTTVEKSLVRLLDRTGEFEREMKGCISGDAEVTQAQYDVLIAWAYNVGSRNACASTLVRKLNAGQEWCGELLRWNRQGTEVLRGLDILRRKQYAQCSGR